MPDVQGGYDYDLIVIGSGPAGQRAAVEAARHGLSVAVVEKQRTVGGVCLHTGTMPSKALREAALSLTGYRTQCMFPSRRPDAEGKVTLAELLAHVDRVIDKELGVIASQLGRQGIALHYGSARFTDPHTISVEGAGSDAQLSAKSLLVATGTVAARPQEIPFDGETIIDSDEIFRIPELPDRMAIVGAGVIAIEYASVFALLGIEVHVLNRRAELLGFLDRQVVGALAEDLAERGVQIHSEATVIGYERDEGGRPVVVTAAGEEIAVDLVMVAAGRVGTAEELQVSAAGLDPTPQGLLAVDERFRTSVPHILAAGDLIGYPSLAAASRVQGRRAIRYLLDLPVEPYDRCILPFGIYTVPEIGYVGSTEGELQAAGVGYVTGLARFKEVARGEIIGDDTGLMKLLFDREDRSLLGAHVIGTDATEIVHLGQTVMAFGGTLDYFVASVVNYPTLSECYKIAALDAEAQLCGAEAEGCVV